MVTELAGILSALDECNELPNIEVLRVLISMES